MAQSLEMQNDTEECIEYVVQEGAGVDPELNICSVRPEDFTRMNPGKESDLEVASGTLVILKNIPPDTQILFYTRKPIKTETRTLHQTSDGGAVSHE